MNKTSSLGRNNYNRLVIISNYAICGRKKSRFIVNQEACGLLNYVCIRTPLNKISLIGDILF